jgi:hypothetical protein
MAEKTVQQQEAAPAQQQQVVSIRVSEALRYRLEHLRKVLSLKSGENVSVSEVAKQLLESADDERVEFVKLISEPIKSLLNVRQKAEAKLPLTQTEWLTVAWFCQRGAEALSDNVQNQVSNESLIGILEAFLAVYNLQNAKRTPRDPFYVANLVRSEEAANKKAQETGSKDVRRAVADSILTLKNPQDQQWKPILAARNLFYVIDETEITSLETLNRALAPYWGILWRVCARGHYFERGEPIFDETAAPEVYDAFIDPPLPRFEEGECSIFLPRGRQGGFALCINLPGKLSPMYPISQFAMISEFRTMMERLDVEHDQSFWRGYYFLAYTQPLVTGALGIAFRANHNGITFHLERDAWLAIRTMLRHAWEHPEVRRVWDEESMRYGEL